jgi:hypothetical protein
MRQRLTRLMAACLALLLLVSVAEAGAPTVVATTGTTLQDAAFPNYTCNLPGGLQANDLVVTFLVMDGAAVTSVGTWSNSATELWDVVQGGGNMLGAAAWFRSAAGAETTQTFVAAGAAEDGACLTAIIRGVPIASSPAQATRAGSGSETPDPPSVNPSWSATIPSLGLVVVESTNADGVDTYPTGYTSNQVSFTTCGTGSTCSLHIATREFTADSEDPNAWNLGGASWALVHNTMAFEGTEAAGSCGLLLRSVGGC